MATKTLICPPNPRWKVVLDQSQVYEDDPGQGTPAMVYGPNDSSGTYFAAVDTGEIICGTNDEKIPGNVMRWLETTVSAEVDSFLYPDM